MVRTRLRDGGEIVGRGSRHGEEGSRANGEGHLSSAELAVDRVSTFVAASSVAQLLDMERCLSGVRSPRGGDCSPNGEGRLWRVRTCRVGPAL